MARVNVEESAWRRISKLASIIGCSDREALGTCVSLWGESQDILKTHGTRDEIIDWAHLFGMSDADQDLWIDALLKARIISEDENETFEIRGNRTQIEGIVKSTTAKAKGGAATKARWEKLNRERKEESQKAEIEQKTSKTELEHSSSIASAIVEHSSSIAPAIAEPELKHSSTGLITKHCITKHCISLHDTRESAEPPHEPALPVKTVSPKKKANTFIARYCDLWREKHGGGTTSPPIVGKDAGIVSRLAKTLSQEKLETYLVAFFEMPDAYFVKAKHPLELFESRLKEIAAFAESGSFITRKQAAQFDDMTGNMLLLQKVRGGKP